MTVSEIEVSYTNQNLDGPIITSSAAAAQVLRENWSSFIEIGEELVVLILAKSNAVKGIFRASKGGMSGTVIDPKIVFSVALKGLAASIILAHNHPSGSLQPSQADIDITKRMKAIGTLLDLPVLDHIILTKNGYFSFADDGIM